MASRVGTLTAVSAFVLACLSGCGGGSAQNETVRGLQEENKVLREQIGTLETRVGELRAENEAGKAGLEPRWGRKVLELRPVGGGGKDGAVASLLADQRLDRATYAGDDRTDLDAFRRLRELQEEGQLSAAVCVGVLSAEAPAELAEESDVTVDGVGGWLAILEWLAEPGDSPA